MQKLQNKTVLLFMPKNFGYENEIKKELENFGAKVIYFDERPKNDFLTKAFIRLNLKKIIQKKINSYYNKIIQSIKNKKIDYLFLINPETIDLNKISSIKKLNKNIKIYTYFWDSIKNKKTALNYLDISDQYFTFDQNDTSFDNKIKFLPLFYINDYENIANNKQNLKFDLSFVGTIHSDRYQIIKKIEKEAKKENLNTFFYFYSPSKILFYLQKFLKKEFKNVSSKDISFKSIDKKEMIDIIKNSKAIIDIQHPNQAGLTMRTIEAFGAKRKFLTTNENIKNYDFYCENNILIFNRINPSINFNFIQAEYKNIEQNIYEQYSLKNWLKNIFKY